MFQSILNIFAFVFSFGVKKLIIFTDGGYPPPFAENSAKIINLIFATFPTIFAQIVFFSATFVCNLPILENYLCLITFVCVSSVVSG